MQRVPRPGELAVVCPTLRKGENACRRTTSTATDLARRYADEYAGLVDVHQPVAQRCDDGDRPFDGLRWLPNELTAPQPRPIDEALGLCRLRHRPQDGGKAQA